MFLNELVYKYLLGNDVLFESVGIGYKIVEVFLGFLEYGLYILKIVIVVKIILRFFFF